MASEKLTNQVFFRVSDSELQMLQAEAQARYMPLSTYLRSVILLTDRTRILPPTDQISTIVLKTQGEKGES